MCNRSEKKIMNEVCLKIGFPWRKGRRGGGGGGGGLASN